MDEHLIFTISTFGLMKTVFQECCVAQRYLNLLPSPNLFFFMFKHCNRILRDKQFLTLGIYHQSRNINKSAALL